MTNLSSGTLLRSTEEQSFKTGFQSGFLVGGLAWGLLVYLAWAAITGMVFPGVLIGG